MIGLKTFKYDIEWIQNQIQPSVSKEEITDNIEILKNLKLIVEDPQGTLNKAEETIFFQYKDEMDEASHRFHRRALSLASNAVGRYSIKEARYSSYFFNIKKDSVIPAIHELIDFNKAFISRYEAEPGVGEATYQVAVQFIPFVKG